SDVTFSISDVTFSFSDVTFLIEQLTFSIGEYIRSTGWRHGFAGMGKLRKRTEADYSRCGKIQCRADYGTAKVASPEKCIRVCDV
ncbi:MAG: hypothetical protein LBG18_05555, partial [Mediterranea sp.]|nr:hypothetical protein [Mediterranea sp.]